MLDASWFHATGGLACSHAQVHKGRLATGEQVAVKLQYPGLRKAVISDLGTLKRLTRIAAAFFPEFRREPRKGPAHDMGCVCEMNLDCCAITGLPIGLDRVAGLGARE